MSRARYSGRVPASLRACVRRACVRRACACASRRHERTGWDKMAASGDWPGVVLPAQTPTPTVVSPLPCSPRLNSSARGDPPLVRFQFPGPGLPPRWSPGQNPRTRVSPLACVSRVSFPSSPPPFASLSLLPRPLGSLPHYPTPSLPFRPVHSAQTVNRHGDGRGQRTR